MLGAGGEGRESWIRIEADDGELMSGDQSHTGVSGREFWSLLSWEELRRSWADQLRWYDRNSGNW